MHFRAAARAVRRYHNTGKDKKKLDTCCVYSDLAAIQRAICHIFIYCTAVTEKTTAVRQCVFFFDEVHADIIGLAEGQLYNYNITCLFLFLCVFAFSKRQNIIRQSKRELCELQLTFV